MSTRQDPWTYARATIYVVVATHVPKLLAPASIFTIRLEPSRIPAIWVWDFYGGLLVAFLMFTAERWTRRAWRRWQTGS